MRFNRSTTGRTAIVLAAGSGTRLGAGTNKVWLPLGGRPLATWSIRWVIESKLFDRIVVVTHPSERDFAREVTSRYFKAPIEFVDGGNSRHGSETNALEHIGPSIERGDCRLVMIHDGARPLAGPTLIKRMVNAAERDGGALPYLETAVLDGAPADAQLVRVQTPQIFEAATLLRAYRAAAQEGFEGSDTSMCIERYAPELHVTCVRGSAQNLKVTYPQDLVMAEHILAHQNFELR